MTRDFLESLVGVGVVVAIIGVVVAVGALAERGEPDYNERYTVCTVVQDPPGLRCVTSDIDRTSDASPQHRVLRVKRQVQ